MDISADGKHGYFETPAELAAFILEKKAQIDAQPMPQTMSEAWAQLEECMVGSDEQEKTRMRVFYQSGGSAILAIILQGCGDAPWWSDFSAHPTIARLAADLHRSMDGTRMPRLVDDRG